MWQVAERGRRERFFLPKGVQVASCGAGFFTLLKITTLFRCLKIKRLPKEL